MNRLRNIFMLAVWILGLIYGVVAVCCKIEISPVIFICAVLICIMHYLENVIDER